MCEEMEAEVSSAEIPTFHNLALSIDYATLSTPFSQFLLYEDEKKTNAGINIGSLLMLPPDITYWTENGTGVVRTSSTEVKLRNGEEEVLVIIPEQDEEPPCPGILVVEGKKPVLLEADESSAEKMVEKLTKQRLFEGIPVFEDIPLTKKKSSLTKYFGLGGKSPRRRGVSTGQVIFCLSSLVLNKTYLFVIPDGDSTMGTITRTSEHEYKINGCSYRSAEVQQELEEDETGLVDYVFPNLSPRRKPEATDDIISKLSGQYDFSSFRREDDSEEADDYEAGEDVKEEVETELMMKQFEENLKKAVKNRQQEKEAKMAKLMEKYQHLSSEDENEWKLEEGGSSKHNNNNNDNIKSSHTSPFSSDEEEEESGGEESTEREKVTAEGV